MKHKEKNVVWNTDLVVSSL